MVVDRASNGFGAAGFTELDEARPFMQNVPNDLADPMSDGPDRLNIAEADDQALENRL